MAVSLSRMIFWVLLLTGVHLTITIPTEFINSLPLITDDTDIRTIWSWHEDYLDDSMNTRNFRLDPGDRWPINRMKGQWAVIIPYVTSNLEPEVYEIIRHYMDLFHSSSCIRWVERTNEREFVTFTGVLPPYENASPDVCRASLGRMSARYIYLSSRCLYLHTPYPMFVNVPHEMMHVLGFIHEHQRSDRDCYIYFTGNLANNNPSDYGMDKEYSTDESFPYDAQSVMQYYNFNDDMHSRFDEPLGPVNDTMSMMDWIKLNFIYCKGPHICEVDSALCKKHRRIQMECRNNV